MAAKAMEPNSCLKYMLNNNNYNFKNVNYLSNKILFSLHRAGKD